MMRLWRSRIQSSPLCDVLLGAAYADKHLRDSEKDEVRALLKELAGELPPEVEARIPPSIRRSSS